VTSKRVPSGRGNAWTRKPTRIAILICRYLFLNTDIRDLQLFALITTKST